MMILMKAMMTTLKECSGSEDDCLGMRELLLLLLLLM